MFERYDFHQLVAEWLATHDYSYHHEFRMPEYGIVDFLAQHADGHILLVECKVGTATQFKKSLRQVLNYQRQIPGSVAGYAIPADLVTETLSERCKARGILLISIDIPENVKQSVREYELRRAQTPRPVSPANQNLPKAKPTFLFLGRFALLAYRDYVKRYQQKMQMRGYEKSSEAHFNALSYLDSQGTRIVTLAERANMTKQSMGDLVRELEQQGYVERTEDPSDKRASIIHFTERGQQFMVDAYEVKLETEAEYRVILGEARAELFFDMAKGILEDTTYESIT